MQAKETLELDIIKNMKLYLFGGAETDQGQAPILKKQISNVIKDIKTKTATTHTLCEDRGT